MSKSHKQNETRECKPVLKRPAPSVSLASEAKTSKIPNESSVNVLEDVQSKESGSTSSVKSAIHLPIVSEKNPAEKTRDSASISKLPEGFFDDKYKDAKMRNVPFKDKLTEEVELFQKEMISLEKQSEKIMEKEMNEMVSGRELDEIDTQLKKWERIQHLQLEIEALESKRRGQYSHIQKMEVKEEPKSSSESESEADELYDFRVKNTV